MMCRVHYWLSYASLHALCLAQESTWAALHCTWSMQRSIGYPVVTCNYPGLMKSHRHAFAGYTKCNQWQKAAFVYLHLVYTVYRFKISKFPHCMYTYLLASQPQEEAPKHISNQRSNQYRMFRDCHTRTSTYLIVTHSNELCHVTEGWEGMMGTKFEHEM